jgi:hypothetical protein
MPDNLIERLRAIPPKVTMAVAFVRGISHGAAEEGNKGLSLCCDNVSEALTDLMVERAEAAAEITRLRSGGCARDQTTTQFCAEAVALQKRLEGAEKGMEAARKMHAAQQAEAKAQILSEQATERGDTQSADRLREYVRAAAASSNAEREFRAALAAYDATKETPDAH